MNCSSRPCLFRRLSGIPEITLPYLSPSSAIITRGWYGVGMGNPKIVSLYESLLQRGSVSRMGGVTVMRMDGSGAIATTTVAFTMAMRWAQGRQSSNNLHKDRTQFLDRIDVLFARSGSITPSRGSTKPMLQLLRDMESAGLDPLEWNVPSSIKEALEEEAKTHGSVGKPKGMAEVPASEGTKPETTGQDG